MTPPTPTIEDPFQEIGSSYDDWFEVHTLTGSEPDVECIHLTKKAKAKLTLLITKAEQTAYKRGWNDRESDLINGLDRTYGAKATPLVHKHEYSQTGMSGAPQCLCGKVME